MNVIIVILFILLLTTLNNNKIQENFHIFWRKRTRPVLRRVDKYHYTQPYPFIPNYLNPFFIHPRVIYLPY